MQIIAPVIPAKSYYILKGICKQMHCAYDFFKEEKDITVLHCMAHARRMFLALCSLSPRPGPKVPAMA